MSLNKLLKKMSKETGISVEQIAKIIVANHLLSIMGKKYPDDLSTLDIQISKRDERELKRVAKILEVDFNSIIVVAAYNYLKER